MVRPHAPSRLLSLDLLRGLVMVLMTIDHASGAFNAGRLMADSAARWHAGTPLPAGQFLTRWITHLCAPTFVLLAGTALALSVERRLRKGEAAWRVDRFIVQRGLLIAALDPLWMSLAFVPGKVLLQVLYAIGGGLVCMAALRRLPASWLLGLSLGLMAGSEALCELALRLCGGRPNLPVIVAYPLVPWLAVMMLGWALGRYLLRCRDEGQRPERLIGGLALGALVVFLAVRRENGYGNMLLVREGPSVVQWLHVSKYPPSLSFYALELGFCGLLLALFMNWERRHVLPRLAQPVLVLGQTALFYYLLHAHLLELSAHLLGVQRQLGLGATCVAAAATVALLLPLCAKYLRYKRAHPEGWTRYL